MGKYPPKAGDGACPVDLEKISSSIMGKYRPEAGGRAKDWLSEPGSVNLGAYLLTIGLGELASPPRSPGRSAAKPPGGDLMLATSPPRSPGRSAAKPPGGEMMLATSPPRSPGRSAAKPPGGDLMLATSPPRLPGRSAAKPPGGDLRPLDYLLFGFGFFAGILRVSSSARLISAAGGFARQSPGTITYPPILCPAMGSKSPPPDFLTLAISSSGSSTKK